MPTNHVPVLIVGGGTVGLATAVFLGHHGIPATVLERRPGPLDHPRALGINERTLELLREVGLREQVEEAFGRLPTAAWRGSVNTLAESAYPPLGDALDFRTATVAEVSPAEVLGTCPQDRLDAILLPAARAHGATVRFGASVASVATGPDGATVTLADGSVLHADHVIAADGASSTVREALGIAAQGPGTLGVPKMNIVFRAELYERFGSVPFMTDITSPGAWAVLIAVDGTDRWMLHVDCDPAAGAHPDDFTPERCAALVRGALGADDIPVELLSVASWRLTARVAERFRDGRFFLVGDAAHTIPPLGAFGMNTGVADGHNLAWKLAAVLRGDAEDALLDTYHTERHPVAEFTLRQAMARLRNPALHWNPFAAAERQKAGAVATPVVQLGYRYDSTAVVGADLKLPSTEDVRQNLDGSPGSRMPHLWVERDGERLSTLDLPGSRFAVLTGPVGDGWYEAAEALAASRSDGLTVYRMGGGGLDVPEGRWLALAGTGPEGALLVRPDGFVAWRATTAAEDAKHVLGEVLDRVLGRR
ncbi:FAD-dependent monooxygenase [Streptomyces sp. NPDC001858]